MTPDAQSELRDMLSRLPANYYICQKNLWCGNTNVEINHVDNDLDKELDIKEAVVKMLRRLNCEDVH